MIFSFFDFLKERKIDYRLLHGYVGIFNKIDNSSDYDVLIKKSDFSNIDQIISDFCERYDYAIVQLFYHGAYAKNIFVYDQKRNELLNLDIYGQPSERGITIFTERQVFRKKREYKGVSILRPHQEFITYVIKKVYKKDMTVSQFEHLKTLYVKKRGKCDKYLKRIFKNRSEDIVRAFHDSNFSFFEAHITELKQDLQSSENSKPHFFWGINKLVNRITRPTGLAIAFLGPDGSGKSTVIEQLLRQKMPFRQYHYFHLRPTTQGKGLRKIIKDPHRHKVYSALVSYMKLAYFIFQYNLGWFKNILKLKVRSSLIIFDRYYDDLLVDHRRYRYGGSKVFARSLRYLIPRPDLYFVLTADSNIILQRKKEVSLSELNRQIRDYRVLADNKRYYNIDVNRSPEAVVVDITKILMERMHERY